MLVAFTPDLFSRLDPADQELLTSLGFVPPPLAACEGLHPWQDTPSLTNPPGSPEVHMEDQPIAAVEPAAIPNLGQLPALVDTWALDLTEQPAQALLLERIASSSVLGVHVALPCGTGSRARERPVPSRLKQQGAPQPRPLRDSAHVLGLPGLSPVDQCKVDAANKLADFTVSLVSAGPLRACPQGLLPCCGFFQFAPCYAVHVHVGRPSPQKYNAALHFRGPLAYGPAVLW